MAYNEASSKRQLRDIRGKVTFVITAKNYVITRKDFSSFSGLAVSAHGGHLGV
jgi:hypothetical protein